MTEFEILTVLKERNGSIEYVELLNIGRTGQVHDTFTNEDLIKKLLSDRVLAGNADAYGYIRFGAKGRLRLQQLEQLRQKEAEDAAKASNEKRDQRRHNLLVAIISTVIGSVFGSLITLLLQYYLLP